MSLCSNCHNLLNYRATHKDTLYGLYLRRKELLAQIGMVISFEQLCKLLLSILILLQKSNLKTYFLLIELELTRVVISLVFDNKGRVHGTYTVLNLVKMPLTYPQHTKPPGLRQWGLRVAEVVTIVVNTKKNADHFTVTNEV